ncbi:hypothetical protein ACQUQQ_08685 [Acidithiobacillus ferrooxidans]|uniref:hypothetical protein n=1 Tax=Acidithiobacillus ferrooxidans TaxID=920 RepID=UPI000A6B0A8E
MKIDIKMLPYCLDCDIVAAILLIFNVILFSIMIVTGHPVVGAICSMILDVLWFLCIVES